MNLKYSLLFATLITLSACNAPRIVETYDEFKKAKICRLDPYIIRREFTGPTSRITTLSLEIQPDQSIKGILLSSIVKGIFANYDGFGPTSKIKFMLNTSDNKTEELVFQGRDRSITYNSQEVYGTYVRQTILVENIALAFEMSLEDLRKIITVAKTEFYVESGNDPVKGELDASDKEAFKDFLDKCVVLAGEKK
ncbi:MAG: hypothetical protein K0M45_05980 [Candidatus Paracaedibacteraceae bacterium]|nr:hypothetical protein [Candidatus Paracaedibacteraceae bacterium]